MSEEVPKRICIIGAGAAGLVALRRFKSSSTKFSVQVFEQTAQIGGIWRYTEETGENVHSAMYRDLRINIPKEIMSFMDFPFDKPEASYSSHETVLQYLVDYADHFQLWPQIQLNSKVEKVRPVYETEEESDGSADTTERIPAKWRVTVSHVTSGESEALEFEHVIISNGHFSVPYRPTFENLEEFTGQILHSKDYRNPDSFAGKRVVVVGSGPSGIDIALEIAPFASQVFMSLRNPPLASFLHSNIEQVPPIKSACRTGFIFENGREFLNCDSLVLCTGYEYSFGFLEMPEIGIKVEECGQRVTPLYKQMLHPETRLVFLGLPFHCIPFYLCDIQIRWFIRFLEGKMHLPSIQEMHDHRLADEEKRRQKGLTPKKTHQLGVLQWDYYFDLAHAAGFHTELKAVTRKIMERATQRRYRHAATFKNDRFIVIDDENCECIDAD